MTSSSSHPCSTRGLAQMTAMRYGTIPCVRATGGLRDTVFDVDTDKSRAAWEINASTNWETDGGDCTNGFSFEGTAEYDLDYALDRCIDAFWNDTAWFRSLQARVMRQDWTWNKPRVGVHRLVLPEHREVILIRILLIVRIIIVVFFSSLSHLIANNNAGVKEYHHINRAQSSIRLYSSHIAALLTYSILSRIHAAKVLVRVILVFIYIFFNSKPSYLLSFFGTNNQKVSSPFLLTKKGCTRLLCQEWFDARW